MKLLYLANARIPTPRAYGLQIMKTCEALGGAGVEVELITPTRNYKTEGDPFLLYGAEKNFTFTTIRTPDLLHFGRLGFLLSAIWFAEQAHFFKSFWTADVIYSRDALILFQYLLLGCRLVFEAHTPPSFIAIAVARRAYRVVVISNGLKRAYTEAGIPESKIVVAPDAVDASLFDTIPDRTTCAREVGLPQDKKIVLYAGHLYPRKGADILAHAAALVPGALCVFVGGAPEEVDAFRKKWASVANVLVVGHVAHERVPWYLRAADVLVLPNSGKDADAARFTSPMKLFEYMASGTPIVASDVPALREVLDDTSALFFSPDDAASLSEQIRESLAKDAESGARGLSARAKVEHYTWKKRAQTILAAL